MLSIPPTLWSGHQEAERSSSAAPAAEATTAHQNRWYGRCLLQRLVRRHLAVAGPPGKRSERDQHQSTATEECRARRFGHGRRRQESHLPDLDPIDPPLRGKLGFLKANLLHWHNPIVGDVQIIPGASFAGSIKLLLHNAKFEIDAS